MESLIQRFKALPVLTGQLSDFDTSAVPATPQALFMQWLDDALERGVSEPQVTTLSTVDPDGAPDARSVMLLDVGEEGWHFAANAASPKGRQMARQPQAAMTFYWPGTARQVRLRGEVIALPREAGLADFRSRPEKSRAAILAARQSEVLDQSADLDRALAQQLERLQQDPELASEHWTMYALKPLDVEFWQSNGQRRFTRLRYRRQGQQWTRQLLWP
ncbi:pyridoxine/pyridoxamine 5'-phosphate oxidase [Roseateles flavus]|uniref:Pyridoxal 5'-phosphate synthase n=1 Tax=Roseateles flavus TaxID=3149041 RepID=A0ABV0GFK7_9BURK